MLSELWTTLLADLQALYAAHQSAHWRASGEPFYGDHLMFQRMYESIAGEIDQVAEKLLGITGDDTLVAPAKTLTAASLALKTLSAAGDPASALFVAEKTFLKQLCGLIEALEALKQLTPGVDNLLAAIADKHESHVYMLSRRVGIEVLKVCVKEAMDSSKSRLLADIALLKLKIAEGRTDSDAASINKMNRRVNKGVRRTSVAKRRRALGA